MTVRKINGIDIEYLDMGEGEPVVFVHGANSDYRAWGYYEVPISEEFRYISYTQRYFGTQPWPDAEMKPTIQDYVNDLATFIESLDAGPVHVVSWSFGGKSAAFLTGMRPDLFKSAIHYEAVDDGVMGDDKQYAIDREALFRRFAPVMEPIQSGDFDSAAMRFVEWAFAGEYGTFVREKTGIKRMILDNSRTLRFLMNPEIQVPLITCDFLKGTRVPTLVVHGEHTNAAWTAVSRRMVDCMPNARLAVLKGVHHDGPIRAVKPFTEMILNFVREHSGD